MCSKHLLSRFRKISADFWVRKYNFDQPVQWQDSNNSFLKEKLWKRKNIKQLGRAGTLTNFPFLLGFTFIQKLHGMKACVMIKDKVTLFKDSSPVSSDGRYQWKFTSMSPLNPPPPPLSLSVLRKLKLLGTVRSRSRDPAGRWTLRSGGCALANWATNSSHIGLNADLMRRGARDWVPIWGGGGGGAATSVPHRSECRPNGEDESDWKPIWRGGG